MRLEANGARLSITTTPEGVVTITGKGDLSRIEIFSAMEIAWISRRNLAGKDGYKGLVVDLRRVRIEIEDRAAGVRVPSILAAGQDVAAAMVVRRDQLARARNYCLAAAEKGIVFGAFINPEQALDWAVSRSLALQHHRMRSQRRELAMRLRTLGGEDQDLQSGRASAPSREPED